jgi:hypothetical protein
VRADSRIQKAVEYQIKNPNLTLCDAMKLADFSLREQEDKAKYMMVIWLLNKTKKDDFVTPPAQLSITVSRSSSDLLSSVTMSADGGVTSAPAKKAMRVPHSTATSMQMRRKAAFEKKNEYNTAFKRATIVYVWEKGKDDGMSARTVVDLIRNDCGIDLCPRTIQKKVKEGEIGCSPLRRGPKGNIPELHYKNLCTAFGLFVTINQLNGNMRMCSAKKYGPLIFKVAYGDHEGASRTKLLNRVLRDTGCNLNNANRTTPRTGASDGQTTGTSPCGLTIGRMILWSWGLLLATQQQGKFLSQRIS